MTTSELMQLIQGLNRFHPTNEDDRQTIERVRGTFLSQLYNNRPLTTETFNTLLDGVSSLYDIASKERNFSQPVSQRFINDLNELSGTLSQVRVNRTQTLYQAVDELGHLAVSAQGKIDKVGAQSSSREMISLQGNGAPVEGFFTEEEKVFDDPAYDEIFRRYRSQYPDDPVLQDLCNRMEAHPMGAYSLYAAIEPLTASELTYGKPESIKDPSDFLSPEACVASGLIGPFSYSTDIERGRISVEKLNDLMKSKAVSDMVREYVAHIDPKEATALSLHNLHYGIGMMASGVMSEPGSSISGRNVAMSRVANILGTPDLLARSVPVTLERNGKTVNGVFMEKANGVDIPGFTVDSLKNSPFLTLKEDAFDGAGLRQVADLQILDYICQNVDRHSQNFLYHFDQNGKLDGVTGIDNDLSFGTATLDNDKSLQNGTAFQNLAVMSESMAKRIEKLTPEMLTASLQGTGLMPLEISAACQRLKQLQDHLAVTSGTPLPEEKLFVPGRIRVIPDDQWENVKLDDLFDPAQANNKNIFTIMRSAKRSIQRVQKEYAAEAAKDSAAQSKPQKDAAQKRSASSKHFTEAHQYSEDSAARVTERLAQLRSMRENLKNTEGFFHGSHEQYKAMTAALDRLLDLPAPKGDVLNEEERNRFEQHLRELNEATKGYVAYKEPQNDTGRTGTERLRVAKDLAAFTGEYMDTFHTTSLTATERELNQAYHAYRAEREQEAGKALAAQIIADDSNLGRVKLLPTLMRDPVFTQMLHEDGGLEHCEELIAKGSHALLDEFIARSSQARVKEKESKSHEAAPQKPSIAEPVQKAAGKRIAR